MPKQYFSKLSQNLIEMLEDDEYSDVIFEVEEGIYIKNFRAHAIILSYRSPYFKRNLSKNDGDNSFHMKFSNISPEIFQIILKYIYGGFISLDDYDTVSDIMKILLVAEKFRLQELVDSLQKYLIEEKSEWIDQNFELVHSTSLKSNGFMVLQQYCINLMSSYPERIFKSLDFTSLDEKTLMSLLQKNDLQMEEIDIWSSLLKWGLKRNPTLMQDPSNWTDEEFRLMELTLKNVLPHIRFFCLSPKEFLEQVHPYKKLIQPKLYEDLLKYFLDVDSKPPENFYATPRYHGKCDTKIINFDVISLISRWIDDVRYERKFFIREKLYLPYEFNLILRGSRDGFTPKKFHELCDNIENTVSFIKIQGSDEIFGGYNPVKWSSYGGWISTEKSFIFSIKSKDHCLKDVIFSKVKDKDYAIRACTWDGPGFGKDVKIYGPPDKDYQHVFCEKRYYEREIRDTEDKVSIEDYEVFQIKEIK